MDTLAKLKKQELIELVRSKIELVKSKQEEGEEYRRKNFKIMKEEGDAGRHLAVMKANSEGHQLKLDKIKQAILTVAALKHPDAEIGEVNTEPGCVRIVSSEPEPEELLFLRHLYDLAN